jgi:hypothetical protein
MTTSHVRPSSAAAIGPLRAQLYLWTNLRTHGGNPDLNESSDSQTITPSAFYSIKDLVSISNRIQKDPLLRELSKVSFGISFDASSSQTSTTQGFAPSANNLSGFSTKYQLLDHRDPRDHKWYAKWAAVEQEGLRLAKTLGDFNAAVTENQNYSKWQALAVKVLSNLSSASSDDDIRKRLQSLGDVSRFILG